MDIFSFLSLTPPLSPPPSQPSQPNQLWVARSLYVAAQHVQLSQPMEREVLRKLTWVDLVSNCDWFDTSHLGADHDLVVAHVWLCFGSASSYFASFWSPLVWIFQNMSWWVVCYWHSTHSWYMWYFHFRCLFDSTSKDILIVPCRKPPEMNIILFNTYFFSCFKGRNRAGGLENIRKYVSKIPSLIHRK